MDVTLRFLHTFDSFAIFKSAYGQYLKVEDEKDERKRKEIPMVWNCFCCGICYMDNINTDNRCTAIWCKRNGYWICDSE
jgi:hypothetical protein